MFSKSTALAALAMSMLVIGAGPASADPVPFPAMVGTLAANPKPPEVDAGPLGKINVDGVVSGLGFYQDSVAPGDRQTFADIANGQVFVQKTTGVVQFYLQAGVYSLPTVGVPYVKATTLTQNTYGALPQAFVKIVANANWSIQAGKLPTLIGPEGSYTFQNMNIQRGLLWGQENVVTRAVQINYTKGPLALSASYGDGYYSNKWNWLTGSLTYTLSKTDTLALIGGGNLGHTARNSFATPVAQNNGQIYNIIWTHTQGPWMVIPYFQYSYAPANADVSTAIGAVHSASTASGALLVQYALKDPAFHLAVRGEYISTTGSAAEGAANLLYGPGSKALSFTLTPTWQKGIFFLRGEYSYVHAYDVTPGLGLGYYGVSKKQNRLLIECGVLF